MPSRTILPEEADPWHQVKAHTEAYTSLHEQYWYRTVGYALASLLDHAGYTHQRQVSILYHFSSFVTPYLGASPWADAPRWESFMTDDHSPVELSWDFHTGCEEPTIRYSIEPIKLGAGTGIDSNNGAAADFMRGLMKAAPEADTTLLDHFEAYFHRGWGDDAPEGHPSSMFWAFDLNDKDITNKAYFFPGTLAHRMNRTNLSVIREVITSSPGYNRDQLPSFEIYTDYVERNPHVHFEMDMLALDLTPVENSRLKIYFRDRRTTFSTVRENMSLGGRLSGVDFETGIQRLRRLWDALLGTHGLSDKAHLPENHHRTAGILYNVEFKTGCKTPKVKVYIPVRHYAENDQQVIRALTEFLTDKVSERKLPRAADLNIQRYSQCLNRIFDSKALEAGLGALTYVACSIQEGGHLRVVSYINPQEAKLRSVNLDNDIEDGIP